MLKRLMFAGGAGCQKLLSLLLTAVEMCSVCHTFCAVDVGGPMVKDVPFISIYCGEF